MSDTTGSTERQDDGERGWRADLADLARGFCGALFVALPLLYTMEMWERSRLIPGWALGIVLVITYFANVGYTSFTGFRDKRAVRNIWWDPVIAMGLGIVAAVITLFIVGRIGGGTPTEILLKLIALETVIGSIGASVAINQLGSKSREEEASWLQGRDDLRKLVGSALGALLFAFNIAPTIEPRLIALSLNWWHCLAVMAFSLFISYVMVTMAQFTHRDEEEAGVLGPPDVETTVCYLLALGLSAFLLWMFGYLDLGSQPTNAVPNIIVLAYATTIGGAAGRLIL